MSDALDQIVFEIESAYEQSVCASYIDRWKSVVEFCTGISYKGRGSNECPICSGIDTDREVSEFLAHTVIVVESVERDCCVAVGGNDVGIFESGRYCLVRRCIDAPRCDSVNAAVIVVVVADIEGDIELDRLSDIVRHRAGGPSVGVVNMHDGLCKGTARKEAEGKQYAKRFLHY